MVAMEPFLLTQATARRAEQTTLLPGARIASASTTWACCQTRSENSGANGAKTTIIVVGRVRTSITSFS